MQYEAKTPAEYLEKLENDWRKQKLLQIRTLIKKIATDINESIEYKMLGFGYGDKNIFHLNAQRHYVSLYVGNIDKIDNAEQMLKAFDRGKGCIRVRKSVEISKTKLEDFIKKTLEVWKKGGNTDC